MDKVNVSSSICSLLIEKAAASTIFSVSFKIMAPGSLAHWFATYYKSKAFPTSQKQCVSWNFLHDKV